MAKLKGVLSEDEYGQLDSTRQDLYEKAADGNYTLSIDNAEDLPTVRGMKSALSRYKSDEAELRKKIEAMQSQYGGIDPDKAKAALKLQQDIEEKKLIESGKFEELVAQREARLIADHKNQISGFQSMIDERDQKLAEINTRYNRTMIENAVTTGITRLAKELGIKPTATRDIIGRARDVFSVDKSGSLSATREDGSAWFGSDPSKPISVEEWITSLKKDCPHYFEASASGGGATGGRGSGGRPAKRSDMTAKERAAYIAEHGSDAYLDIPA